MCPFHSNNMLLKNIQKVNESETKGSSLSLPAHGWVGARATSILAEHFALRNTASDASEKSESGKERAGRNSPQTPLPPRPKNKVSVAKCFRRLGIKTSKQNNFQFLLRKIWRAGVKKLKENCFALLAEFRRAETLGRGFKSFERLSLEKGSSFVQQLRPT